MISNCSNHLFLLFLSQQVQYARTGAASKDFNKVYFMLTTSDRFVIGFRQWLSKFGHADVQYAPGVDPRIPEEVLPKEVGFHFSSQERNFGALVFGAFGAFAYRFLLSLKDIRLNPMRTTQYSPERTGFPVRETAHLGEALESLESGSRMFKKDLALRTSTYSGFCVQSYQCFVGRYEYYHLWSIDGRWQKSSVTMANPCSKSGLARAVISIKHILRLVLGGCRLGSLLTSNCKRKCCLVGRPFSDQLCYPPCQKFGAPCTHVDKLG
jgi:hypothetical protein